MKRLIDFSFSSILLVVLLPLFALLSLLLYCCLGSPILFKQTRSGLHGHPFVIYKFRTMTNAVTLEGKPLSDKERLTRLGIFMRKYSLDEIPQLINVWKGDMSFIGPRPLLMEYIPLYNQKQVKRLFIKPGLTGWAQVNGRNAISWEEKFELDVWYVENRTFQLDVKILCMTILRVFQPVGISHPASATMKRFTGSKKEPSA
ncbi:sugar transferase [Jeotgalibacillus proteolyticus]|uniref:Sugar transferase n=1 Tax=Jeotgalibacillus proteolyticus TaxID=2082395 RepID=A0A2S5GBU0_9BACL|nr:sugar transferase [Jeotgalibacillus proteolyticus]PPA70507.1 sugar transferase [Jeotgalibacillus proteolyticus]